MSMRVFVNILPLGLDLVTTPREELTKSVFDAVRSVYDTCCGVPDAYLKEEHPLEIQCVFGNDEADPQMIQAEAANWNLRLRADFEKALTAVKDYAGNGYRGMPLCNMQTYFLKKAAMALDNTFYAFADYATLLDSGHTCLRAVISEEDLARIIEHPENYAIIEVYPK